ncbi:MAG: aldo/keto reductase [Candidatus Omnitrophica bacterium]|nr:aldo/keto reductase [Candidatus Omnitrophota bacterium]
MEYRQLGKSGLRVSKLCIGTMVGFTFQNYEEAKKIIEVGIDNGINFIDTADCYGESEEVVGKILKETGKREKVVLATKFGWYMGDGPNDYGASIKHIIDACETSLKRLNTDYIDLYIVHVVDPNTPMEETLYALNKLVKDGKVRYIGTSKHPTYLILEGIFISEKYGWARFVSEQPPYNILDRSIENELIPMAIRYGIGITPFFPLGAGLLSGKYRKEGEIKEGRIAKKIMKIKEDEKIEKSLDVIEKLIPLAENKGITLAEFSLAWLMHMKGITSVIHGARKLEYLLSGLKACNVKITEEELKQVDEIVPPGTYVYPYYEESIWRPSRMFYSSSARRIEGTGAFIPDHKTGSDKKSGYPADRFK